VELRKREILPAEFRRIISRANKLPMTDRIEITRAETICENMWNFHFGACTFTANIRATLQEDATSSIGSLDHAVIVMQRVQKIYRIREYRLCIYLYEYWKYLKHLDIRLINFGKKIRKYCIENI